MTESDFAVPDAMTFEQAIQLTQDLLAQLDHSDLTETELQSAIADLVATENGARGFFVTYLSDDRPLADQPSDAVLHALQSSPDIVSELLVKNLAMSSAMAITHRRNGNEAMAQGSDRVRSRSRALIEQLHLPVLIEKAQKLHESATTGLGDYKAFLDRWNYDAEQRLVIQKVLEEAIALASDSDSSVNE